MNARVRGIYTTALTRLLLGAGPAVVAACRDGRRRAIAAAMLDAFADADIDARAYQTRIGEAATVIED